MTPRPTLHAAHWFIRHRAPSPTCSPRSKGKGPPYVLRFTRFELWERIFTGISGDFTLRNYGSPSATYGPAGDPHEPRELHELHDLRVLQAQTTTQTLNNTPHNNLSVDFARETTTSTTSLAKMFDEDEERLRESFRGCPEVASNLNQYARSIVDDEQDETTHFVHNMLRVSFETGFDHRQHCHHAPATKRTDTTTTSRGSGGSFGHLEGNDRDL